MRQVELTQIQVREMFSYDNGKLYWRKKTAKKIVVGMEAGTFRHNDGYRQIMIDCKVYRTHRLIFLYHHGYLPKYIDHIDGDGFNNRIENLREATQEQNLHNVPGKSGTKSGKKNVYWNSSVNKWAVHVKVDKKVKCFGIYDDIELAELVAIEARNKYHGQFANHNVRVNGN